MKNKLLNIVYVGICIFINILGLTFFIAFVAYSLNEISLLFGVLSEGIREIGIVLIIFLITFFLSPLSLIPSHFICMKMAKWLREKHGWSIYHPRKLFAMSILIPLLLVILLFSLAKIVS